MKRAPLQRKTPLRKKGKSDAAKIKDHIQAILREIAILRDKKCQRCGVEYGTPGVVFQCDHLLSRAHSATYADSRLCVLLCRPCHAWKSLGSNLRKAQYDAEMKASLPPERVALWERCEQESWRPHRTSAYDWKLSVAALEYELHALKEGKPF